MKAVPHFQLDEQEKKMLRHYYLPLHDLCTDKELMEKAERLVRGDLSTYSEEQIHTITESVIDLHENLVKQASEDFWNGIGLPHATYLARMRENESNKMAELLRSLIESLAASPV